MERENTPRKPWAFCFMREVEQEIGRILIQDAIGLSGHPGLVAEIYSLPVDVPGEYRVRAITDEIGRRRRILVTAVASEGFEKPSPSSKLVMTNESHGGVMIGEHRNLVQIKDHIDPYEPSRHSVWNQIAGGFTDQLLSWTADMDLPGGSFAMVAAEDWLTATPLQKDGLICGYEIWCCCDYKGIQLDPRPPRWDELQRRGELPASENGRGVVKCPHCGVSFKLSSPSLWNGFRHMKCLGRIKLIPREEMEART